MAKRIVWTKRANSKFNRIIEHLNKEWGPSATKVFVRKTYHIIDLLSKNSELGTLEIPERNIRGLLLTGHNRLFYRVKDDEVILLNFFDTRSGPKRKRY